MAGSAEKPLKKQILDIRHLQEKYNLDLTGVIHVGAHLANEHLMYLNCGIKNVVYFEPVPALFERLKSKMAFLYENFTVTDLTVQLYNFALGSENKDDVPMNVEKNDRYGCSSILTPSSNYNHIPFVGQKVRMRRLNDISDVDFKKFNYLNIDVQGYELEVLKGATEALEHVDYIMCEINRDTTGKKVDYIGSALVQDICEFLSPYGFELVEEDWPGVSWGDGFFIKRGNK